MPEHEQRSPACIPRPATTRDTLTSQMNMAINQTRQDSTPRQSKHGARLLGNLYPSCFIPNIGDTSIADNKNHVVLRAMACPINEGHLFQNESGCHERGLLCLFSRNDLQTH